MMKFTISSLDILAVGESQTDICYILYPFDCLGRWIAPPTSSSTSRPSPDPSGTTVLPDGFSQTPFPKKTGKAYFLLGDQGAKTSIEAFRPIQTDTEKIVRHLHDTGVRVQFELVPGNHYQHAIPRLDRALIHIFNP